MGIGGGTVQGAGYRTAWYKTRRCEDQTRGRDLCPMKNDKRPQIRRQEEEEVVVVVCM